MASNFKLVVLGGGSAGFAAATRADDLGVRTAVINHGEIGGTCVNRGCVPSKHLLEVGNLLYYAKNNSFESIRAEPLFSFKRAMEDKRKVVEGLREANYGNVIEAMPNVTLFEGKGRFLDGNRIGINGKIIEGEKIVVAVGTRPEIVPFKGVDKVGVLTSDEMLELNEAPKSLIVIGGRALGLEFAQMYAHFGTKVTLLQRSSIPL